MKRISKRILAAAICTVILTGTGGILAWAGRQFEFFEDQDGLSIAYRNASEGDQWVQALSGEIGIRLDPALGKHAELLAKRDRLVVCPNTLQFTPVEGGWFRGSIDRSRYIFSEQSLPADPLYVYTGGFTADGYDVRMALIGMDTALVAQREVPAFEVVIEIRPESGMMPSNTGEIMVKMAGYSNFRWRGTNPDYPDEEGAYQAAYLFASDTGIWFEKLENYYNLISAGSVPSIMLGTPSGGRLSQVDLFQIWGTGNLALLTSDTIRAQFDLYRDEQLWASMSFWYPDGLYQQSNGEGMK